MVLTDNKMIRTKYFYAKAFKVVPYTSWWQRLAQIFFWQAN
jgi:hypothetical protein